MNEADRIVVEAIRGGDAEAFAELYRGNFRRIHNFAIRRLGDAAEAEDVTQEVFTAVFTCLDRYQGKSSLIVWIYGIARNILNNRLRRRSGLRLVPLADVPSDASPRDDGPSAAAEARETLSLLQQAIDELPPEQRRILELRHSRRLAIRRIAELTHRSEDAVKSSLYRARRALAARLPQGSLPGGV